MMISEETVSLQTRSSNAPYCAFFHESSLMTRVAKRILFPLLLFLASATILHGVVQLTCKLIDTSSADSDHSGGNAEKGLFHSRRSSENFHELKQRFFQLELGVRESGRQSMAYFQTVLAVLQEARALVARHDSETRRELDLLTSRVRQLDWVLGACGNDSAAGYPPTRGFEHPRPPATSSARSPMKSLLTMPVRRRDQTNIERVIAKFGLDNFTFVFFKHDSEPWDNFLYAHQTVTLEVPGQLKYWFAERFLTEEAVAPYEYVFVWDGDIDVSTFDVERFLDIMRRHHIQVAQPALMSGSKANHAITRQLVEQGVTGRWVNFVEIMIPVFSRDAWIKFRRELLQPGFNYWGFGYDDAMWCIFDRMAIVDATPVIHPHKYSVSGGGQHPGAEVDMLHFFNAILDRLGPSCAHQNLIHKVHSTF